MHLEITDPTKIQRHRAMLGMSVEKAAELSGIPEARWRNFETGLTPTIHAPFLEIMAEILEVPQTAISIEAPDEEERPVYDDVDAAPVERYLSPYPKTVILKKMSWGNVVEWCVNRLKL